MRTLFLLALGLFILVPVGIYFLNRGSQRSPAVEVPRTEGVPLVAVRLPQQLSETALEGKTLFDANCARCHGANAAGQDGVAPPLVHQIYEPGHHGDESFQRAAALGARAHHWPFGDMPPVEGITRAEVTKIISYIRALQRENGI